MEEVSTIDPGNSTASRDDGLSAQGKLAPSDSAVLPGWFGFAPRIDQWTWMFVAVGVALRLFRYLLPFPLWCDEFQLADNFLDRNFAGLTEPLNNNQVAPPGFLWIELASTRLLGFHEWSLRLLPFACSVASLFLMRHVSRRLLTGVSQVLAVALLAVAYYPIRLGAEVKPYAGDLMCSLVILTCVVEWQRDRGRSTWVWILAAVMGPILLLSFPSVFVGGAASLAFAGMLAADWREGRRPSRRVAAAGFAYHAVLIGVFGGIVWLNAGRQYHATANEMVRCWADSFPAFSSPGAFASWMVDAHTGVIFAYPIGAENGGSVGTFLGCLLGAWVIGRRGPRWLLIWGAGAFLLTFVAAAMHRYPYGGHTRLAQHLAPAILLTFATGVGALIEGGRTLEWRLHAWRLVCAGCLLLAVGTCVRDLAFPYKSAVDNVHRGFAGWFWNSATEIPTVCVEDDLGVKLHEHSLRSPYRCYRRIHQRKRLDAAAARELVAAGEQPVRCVVFHSASAVRDEAAFAQWLEAMQVHYTLERQNQFLIDLAAPRDSLFEFKRLFYDVYEFVPRSSHPKETETSKILAETLTDD